MDLRAIASPASLPILALTATALLAACDEDRDLVDPGEVTVGTEHEVLSGTSVRLDIDNVGTIGSNADDPFRTTGFFPAESDRSYLLRAGLWIGGRYRGDPVVAVGQDQLGLTEFVAGRPSGSEGGADRILCSSRAADLAAWYPEFRGPSGAPLLVGDRDCVVIYHDGRQNQDYEQQASLGLEIRQRAVLFDDAPASQAVVFVWDVVHSGLFPVEDVQAAFFIYPAIGPDLDVVCSAILGDRREPSLNGAATSRLGVCWDQDFRESGFEPDRPGFLGVSFLRTPAEPAPPRFTILHNPSFSRPGPVDPVGDANELTVLEGAGTSAHWLDNIASDDRLLAITGPFTLRRDEPQRIAAALIWAEPSVPLDDLPLALNRCFTDDLLCFLPDPNHPAFDELIAVHQTVQRIVDDRLPSP